MPREKRLERTWLYRQERKRRSRKPAVSHSGLVPIQFVNALLAYRPDANPEKYYQWRVSVFRRSGWACRHCGASGVELHAHHIKQWAHYPALRYEVSNGEALCKRCHEIYHATKPEERGKTITRIGPGLVVLGAPIVCRDGKPLARGR